MKIGLKLKALVVTTLVILVGFLVDDKFWPAGVAITLFWLLVIVLIDVVRSRKSSKRQMPDVR